MITRDNLKSELYVGSKRNKNHKLMYRIGFVQNYSLISSM